MFKEGDMDNSNERPVAPTRERLHAELRRLDWAKGLSEETLAAIASTAEWAEFRAGDVVIEVESEISHVSFLITGRMHATLYDLLGREIQKDTFARGSVIGLFALGLSDRSHLQVQATEPSTAIRLTLSDLLQLTAKHADFQLAMFRLSANIFKRYVMDVDRSLPKPSVVGIIHQTEASRPLVGRLARRLRELDESPCVAGDDERWKPDGDIPFMLLTAGDDRQSILKDWAAHRRLLVDVRADHSLEAMMRFLSYIDIALWCVRPQDAHAAVDLLQGLEKSVPRWRDKIRIVWLLDPKAPIAPYIPELYELAERDFKLTFDAPGANQSSLLQQGLERIVHHLRGIQIGLALGGGAARGMAHLGVLKALEQNGIYVDMLAGTSAGALTGSVYAAGLDPDYITHLFKTDLRPSWFFRQLPGGGYWYLLYKYRRNQFEPMLRKYLDRARTEQLILPMFAISVDLVEGEPLVRQVGDATVNVLESINLPPLSLPIIRSGQALVDGGLLNNVPANVLVSKGCNFVIASSVTAKLEKDFVGIRSKEGSRSSRSFSTIQVIMRQTMIQDFKMNSVGVQPADFVFAPDVTSFDISEFTRADEMALIGEATTNATVENLRKMLSKLDPKLFETSAAPSGVARGRLVRRTRYPNQAAS
jgi:predicted acylesterase/phospholipase RssA/CRP-like cAMP-binding protein